ncbi:MAG: hypothetical protein IID38_07960, partial [Planctomycetes bacterium]|nr:hypothetical protein [Planctomycetota bacterium]
MPKAKILATTITKMIDLEAKEEATPERKALLGMMADVRGTLGLGLGAIRAYLLSGDDSFKQQFEQLWIKNTRRFGDLTAQIDRLTPAQREAYELFAKTRKSFEPLPSRMFEIRSSDEWNLANKWLATKAAPTAVTIKEDLDVMIASQEQLMVVDMAVSKRQTAILITIEWILLGVGVGLCAIFTWFITVSILRLVGGEPAAIAGVTDQIARGDLDIEIEGGTGIWASVGAMLKTLKENRDQTQRQDWLKTGIVRLNEVM